jgi:hypothetical protein
MGYFWMALSFVGTCMTCLTKPGKNPAVSQSSGYVRRRMRSGCFEELIPIARYVQVRYREGRRIKVRWSSGSQSYDAILSSSGALVNQRLAPRRVSLEVTRAVHANDHLRRRLLHEGGVSFGVKGLSSDKKTRRIASPSRVHTPAENVRDLVDQITERLKSKGEKPYPPGTVLIVDCIANTLLTTSEWTEAIERLKTDTQIEFREVFLVEMVGGHSATLYGERKRRRVPK